MDDLLERSGLRSRKIEGSYVSSLQDGYHCILQRCELELHELSQETALGSPVEAWVEGTPGRDAGIFPRASSLEGRYPGLFGGNGAPVVCPPV